MTRFLQNFKSKYSDRHLTASQILRAASTELHITRKKISMEERGIKYQLFKNIYIPFGKLHEIVNEIWKVKIESA